VLTRRSFLRAGATAGTGLLGACALPSALDAALAAPRPKHALLSDIEHVVILMQENR
jgi:phospholipase C